jgi:hypothetical protein
MQFRDLDEILGLAKPLVLPIRGKEYSFPGEISADLWLKVQRLGAVAQKSARGEEVDTNVEIDQDAFMAELCGPTLDEMRADGVTSEQIKRVFATLVAYHSSGAELALAVWNGQGEAPAPNRAQRRAGSASKAPSRGNRAG